MKSAEIVALMNRAFIDRVDGSGNSFVLGRDAYKILNDEGLYSHLRIPITWSDKLDPWEVRMSGALVGVAASTVQTEIATDTINMVRRVMYYDNAFNALVPSHLRILINEIDRLTKRLAESEAKKS